jgi:nucleoside-diphosphate-sugar epimerase
VIPLFIKAILENKSPLINGDEPIAGFTYVANAVQANTLGLFTENKRALNRFIYCLRSSNILIATFDALKQKRQFISTYARS